MPVLRMLSGLNSAVFRKEKTPRKAGDCKALKGINGFFRDVRKRVAYYGIDHIEEVKRMHIKHFMGMMDVKNRKPQYINDLLKVIKTFFRYAQEN